MTTHRIYNWGLTHTLISLLDSKAEETCKDFRTSREDFIKQSSKQSINIDILKPTQTFSLMWVSVVLTTLVLVCKNLLQGKMKIFPFHKVKAQFTKQYK